MDYLYFLANLTLDAIVGLAGIATLWCGLLWSSALIDREAPTLRDAAAVLVSSWRQALVGSASLAAAVLWAPGVAADARAKWASVIYPVTGYVPSSPLHVALQSELYLQIAYVALLGPVVIAVALCVASDTFTFLGAFYAPLGDVAGLVRDIVWIIRRRFEAR